MKVAIMVAAVIIACGYVLGNLYREVPRFQIIPAGSTTHGNIISWRIDTLTGEVSVCSLSREQVDDSRYSLIECFDEGKTFWRERR